MRSRNEEHSIGEELWHQAESERDGPHALARVRALIEFGNALDRLTATWTGRAIYDAHDFHPEFVRDWSIARRAFVRALRVGAHDDPRVAHWLVSMRVCGDWETLRAARGGFERGVWRNRPMSTAEATSSSRQPTVSRAACRRGPKSSERRPPAVCSHR